LRRFLLPLACGILILTGCGKEEGPAPSGLAHTDYFPMAKGNIWVWAGGVSSAEGDTIRWEVRDSVAMEDGKLAWNIRTERFWGEKGTSIVDSCNVQTDQNLMLLYMDRADPRPDTVLSYPLELGKSWTVTRLAGNDVVRRSRVAGEENVETPYRKFKEVLRVESEDRNVEKDTLLMKTTDWYAPAVGRVMSRVEARGEVWEMRLVTANLR
jgi:hypothetical protein